MNNNKKIWALAESSVCVALATVLSLITLFKMPMGGSVTPFATLPIIVISLRRGVKWGVASALVFSLIQLLLGMSSVAAVPVKNFGYMALCALLDYVLAYTFVGTTGYIARKSQNHTLGITIGVLATGLGRLLCSFLSGILIWAAFTPEGWTVWYYSLAYNATWCLPDVVVTLVACLLLLRVRALGLFPVETE
jgi:thiamine transporter